MSTKTLSYGDHILQTITVHQLPQAHKDAHWVVLIHGGAWRDPTQSATGYLAPALGALTASSSYTSETLPYIAGLASIEYRLSPHPSHPQDPSTIPPREYRSAKHPEPVRDVQAALALLQRKYGFGSRYVLAGHSCGATLAFQVVMGSFRNGAEAEYVCPEAILGMAGIYNLRLLRDTHVDVSAYQMFIEGAFGPDEAVWDAASPVVVEGAGGVRGGWRSGRLAVLAHSEGDSLVDIAQRDAMAESLASWADDGGRTRWVHRLPILGEHDEAWEKGDELASAIAFTVAKLHTVDS
ncbi:arylformamidase [Aspergillus candidus]|uniref:Kynurenine formamidase n=1 Tax=Aspergillus candidus TaxID=41067 RepID=A0A2I2FHB2_ASPCN|nr:alpha/beta-hydrolase [Aspergillus candidus]PLB40027.1 alpha/beta-hydrolase [Aspergillus candidus]